MYLYDEFKMHMKERMLGIEMVECFFKKLNKYSKSLKINHFFHF